MTASSSMMECLDAIMETSAKKITASSSMMECLHANMEGIVVGITASSSMSASMTITMRLSSAQKAHFAKAVT